MISYDPFWALCKARGISTYDLRRTYGISPTVLAKMRGGTGDITTATINRLCKRLGCQPGDLIAYKE